MVFFICSEYIMNIKSFFPLNPPHLWADQVFLVYTWGDWVLQEWRNKMIQLKAGAVGIQIKPALLHSLLLTTSPVPSSQWCPSFSSYFRVSVLGWVGEKGLEDWRKWWPRMGWSAGAVHGTGQRSLELEGPRRHSVGKTAGRDTQRRNTAQRRSKEPSDVVTDLPPMRRS